MHPRPTFATVVYACRVRVSNPVVIRRPTRG